MKSIRWWLLAWFLVGSVTLNLPASGALPMAVEGEPLPSLAPMLERVLPAVVNIYTESRITERQSPFHSDPFFEKFFGTPPMQQREKRVVRSVLLLGGGQVPAPPPLARGQPVAAVVVVGGRATRRTAAAEAPGASGGRRAARGAAGPPRQARGESGQVEGDWKLGRPFPSCISKIIKPNLSAIENQCKYRLLKSQLTKPPALLRRLEAHFIRV